MSDMSRPAVITCAISGALAGKDQCPAVPYTPAEYAAEARRIVDEGAVHIHIHARTPDGAPSVEVEDFQNIRDAIVAEVGDRAIINFSTGTIGVSVQKRVEYLQACRPEIAALNMGSLNYAKYSQRRQEFIFEFVFQNPFSEIVELLTAMRELGIKPEHECFDIGHVASIEPLIDMGLIDAPVHADFIMGVLGGIPATNFNLAAMAQNMPDAPSGDDAPRTAGGDPVSHHWGVIGIGRRQWSMIASALTLGGSIRVGVEDNFYLPDGSMARSNGELVAKARQLVADCGRRPATVEEARSMLGVAAPVI